MDITSISTIKELVDLIESNAEVNFLAYTSDSPHFDKCLEYLKLMPGKSVRCNLDDNYPLQVKYNIRQVPCILYFKDHVYDVPFKVLYSKVWLPEVKK